MTGNETQSAIWTWFNHNSWIWDVLSFWGALVAVRIMRLAPAMTLWGRIIRVVLLLGCLLAVLSYWNNGLGLPLPFVLMFGIWLWVEQTIAQCLKAGHIKPMAWPVRREAVKSQMAQNRQLR